MNLDHPYPFWDLSLLTTLLLASMSGGKEIVRLWWFSSSSWLSSVMVISPVKGHGRWSSIIPPFHRVGINRDMSVCIVTTSIGINLDTHLQEFITGHLVPSRVWVEWRTVVSTLLESGHFKCVCSFLHLFFIDGFYCGGGGGYHCSHAAVSPCEVVFPYSQFLRTCMVYFSNWHFDWWSARLQRATEVLHSLLGQGTSTFGHT